MSPDAITHHARLFPPKARRLRMIRGWMHEERIGAPAVLSLAWGMTVLTGGLLLWGGITHGWSRAVLLLLAAALLRGRHATDQEDTVLGITGSECSRRRQQVLR